MRIGNPELPVYLRMNETAKLLASASFFGEGNAMVLVGVAAGREFVELAGELSKPNRRNNTDTNCP